VLESIFNDQWLWLSVTIGTYLVFAFIQQRIKSDFLRPFLNPLLLSTVLVIIILINLEVPYETYQQGGQYIDYLIMPATVALGIKLYENIDLLKQYYKPILIGIGSGVALHTSLIFIFVKIFNLTKEMFVTLYPKSITTAIAVSVSESLGGLVPLTIAILVLTGVMGAAFGESLLKIFNIKHPVAQGIALGTAAHAVGTSKAIELGDVQGSMSSLSIIVTGIIVVLVAPLVPFLLNFL
jgi:predicted murein hydrolase (TIGR00659 family)